MGISSDPEKRWRNGNGYEHNYLFNRAIQKYGWDNIEHIILMTGLSLEKAKTIESALISKWNLTNHNYGYNLSGGGDGILSDHTRYLMSIARKGKQPSLGRKMSEESKRKVAESLRKYYSTHTPTFLGKHHSAETIEKLKSKIVSDETRLKMSKNRIRLYGTDNKSARAVRQFTMDGVKICDYPYASLAAKKYDLDLSALIKCCRGKQKSCGGYKWRYITEGE